METMTEAPLEYGVAKFILPGQGESGDHYLVSCKKNGILLAVVDGVGHGEEAAMAAKVAIGVLEAAPRKPVISLVQECHEKLRSMRGVVLSLASIDPVHGMMTWLGIGNVQGVLMRAGPERGQVQDELLLRAGLVGSQLPPLQAAVLPVGRGDTLVFATDGIRGDFSAGLSSLESPQRAADGILKRHRLGNDDALALVVRFTQVPL
jgi:phosphoserine phosphatase RsbX